MLPGFIDGHGHVFNVGLQAVSANLLPAPAGDGNRCTTCWQHSARSMTHDCSARERVLASQHTRMRRIRQSALDILSMKCGLEASWATHGDSFPKGAQRSGATSCGVGCRVTGSDRESELYSWSSHWSA